jgi:DNA-binding transcriptional LysR family regulator
VLVAIAHPNLEPSSDWENLAILEYRAASAYHWEVDNFLRREGLRPRVMGELDDSFLMLEAVARGGLVAFVPTSVARQAIKVGRVKALAQFTPTSAGVHALYHQTDAVNVARKAVESLIEHARQQFERDD